MNEIAHLRSKAETCLRLAEAATSARATELFKRMAGEYSAQADELERPIASPPIVPPVQDVSLDVENGSIAVSTPSEPDHELADTDSEPVFEMYDNGSPSLAPITGMDTGINERFTGTDTGINEQFTGLGTGINEPVTGMIPPLGPQANSAQWLAELQALRNRL